MASNPVSNEDFDINVFLAQDDQDPSNYFSYGLGTSSSALTFALEILREPYDALRQKYSSDPTFSQKISAIKESFGSIQIFAQKIDAVQKGIDPNAPPMHMRLIVPARTNDVQAIRTALTQLDPQTSYIGLDLSTPLHELLKQNLPKLEAAELLVNFCPDWAVLKDASGNFAHDYITDATITIDLARTLYKDPFEEAAYLALRKDKSFAKKFIDSSQEMVWQTAITNASWEKMKRVLHYLCTPDTKQNLDVAVQFVTLLQKVNKTLPIRTLVVEVNKNLLSSKFTVATHFEWPQKYQNDEWLTKWKYRVPSSNLACYDDMRVAHKFLELSSSTLARVYFQDSTEKFSLKDRLTLQFSYAFLSHSQFPHEQLEVDSQLTFLPFYLSWFTQDIALAIVRKIPRLMYTNFYTPFLNGLQHGSDISKCEKIIDAMSHIDSKEEPQEQFIKVAISNDLPFQLAAYLLKKKPALLDPLTCVRRKISELTAEQIEKNRQLFFIVIDPIRCQASLEEIIKCAKDPNSSFKSTEIFDVILRSSFESKGSYLALAPYEYLKANVLNSELMEDQNFFNSFITRCFSDGTELSNENKLEIFEMYSERIEPHMQEPLQFILKHLPSADWIAAYFQKFDMLSCDGAFRRSTTMGKFLAPRFKNTRKELAQILEHGDYQCKEIKSGKLITHAVRIIFTYLPLHSIELFSGYITTEKALAFIEAHKGFTNLLKMYPFIKLGLRISCFANSFHFEIMYSHPFLDSREIYATNSPDEFTQFLLTLYKDQKNRLIKLYPDMVILLPNEPLPQLQPNEVVLELQLNADYPMVIHKGGFTPLAINNMEELHRQLFWSRTSAVVLKPEGPLNLANQLKNIYAAFSNPAMRELVYICPNNTHPNKALFLVKNGFQIHIAKIVSIEPDSLRQMARLTEISTYQQNLVISPKGCNSFARINKVNVPTQKKDVDIHCLMKKFQEYIKDTVFVDSLKKQDVDVKKAEENLSYFLKAVSEKRGINGWNPDTNKAQYDRLEIQLTHLISKFLETNDKENLRSLVFEYAIFGKFCSGKISEIAHQFWGFSFGSLSDLSKADQIQSLLQMIYSQAFNQTVFEINKMQGHAQEIHTYQCLRKILKESSYILPYDPSLDDSMQDPNNDPYASTGKDDFPRYHIDSLFPSLLKGNLIERFQNIQNELVREKRWKLLGDFVTTLKDAVEHNLSQGIGWISPEMQDGYMQKVKEKEWQHQAAKAMWSTALNDVDVKKSHPDVIAFIESGKTLEKLQARLESNKKECDERKTKKKIGASCEAQDQVDEQFPLPFGQKRKIPNCLAANEMVQSEYEFYAKEVEHTTNEISACEYIKDEIAKKPAVLEFIKAQEKLAECGRKVDEVMQDKSSIRLIIETILKEQKLCDTDQDIPLLENNAWIFIMQLQGFLQPRGTH